MFWPQKKRLGLAVPHSHPALDKIFGDIDYHKGGWSQALKQAPDAVVPRRLERRHQVVKITCLAFHLLTAMGPISFNVVTGKPILRFGSDRIFMVKTGP